MDSCGDGRACKKARRSGETFVVAASGPSLTNWQIDHIRDKARAIGTNTSFRAVPKGQICYAADGEWWDVYHEEAQGREGWTGSIEAAEKYGLKYVKIRTGQGLCTEPWAVNSGRNSGFQAINLAYHLGASKIVLIGFDMQHTGGQVHWHGDHPGGLKNGELVAKWGAFFPALAADLESEGVQVVNCSIETALTCFECADLRDVL